MPTKHLVTVNEINLISGLGYTLMHTPPPPAEELINQKFNGFQPHEFLKSIEQLLGSLAVSPLNRYFKILVTPPSISIYFYSDDNQDVVNGLVFARTFTHDSFGIITVNHDYFRLPKSARGKNIGKQVLGVCFDQYMNIGVSKITVHAALQDGGYVWARAGFKAIHKAEMELILKEAENQLPQDKYNIVKVWYDYHYNNFSNIPFNISDWAGLTFMEPILRGSSWHGEIDLTNPIELHNFKKYVSK